MTFQDDLDFAKQVQVLRDAFITGEMNDYSYIKTVIYEDSIVFRYTQPGGYQTVFRMNEYGFDGVSSFQACYSDYMLFHHNKPTKIWVSEIEDWISANDLECTEEFHFQQSLLYSEQTVKELITFSHLIENPMPEKYEYFRMSMKYFFEMHDILNLIRDTK